jgi:hypothetical protein
MTVLWRAYPQKSPQDPASENLYDFDYLPVIDSTGSSGRTRTYNPSVNRSKKCNILSASLSDTNRYNPLPMRHSSVIGPAILRYQVLLKLCPVLPRKGTKMGTVNCKSPALGVSPASIDWLTVSFACGGTKHFLWANGSHPAITIENCFPAHFQISPCLSRRKEHRGNLLSQRSIKENGHHAQNNQALSRNRHTQRQEGRQEVVGQRRFN